MFRKDYGTYTLVVDFNGENYVVLFIRPTTHIGTGVILSGYESEQLAEAAAEKFHEVYQYVQTVGFTLDLVNEPKFVNYTRRFILVQTALHMERHQLTEAILSLNRQ